MVNRHIVNDAYPLHQIKDQLDAMEGETMFTTLDLTKQYHQMKLNKESKEITAFQLPKDFSSGRSFQWE